jgi:hypothetical protein
MEASISAFTKALLANINPLLVIAGLFGLMLFSGLIVLALNWLERRVERSEFEKKILSKNDN